MDTTPSAECVSPEGNSGPSMPVIAKKDGASTFRAIRIASAPGHGSGNDLVSRQALPRLTNVAGFATTSFALRSPTNAMNRPMPAAVPCFRQSGMPLTICSRTLVSVSSTNKHAGEEDYAERRVPGNAAPSHDRVGEVGVQRHAGRDRNGIVRLQAHHE